MNLKNQIKIGFYFLMTIYALQASQDTTKLIKYGVDLKYSDPTMRQCKSQFVAAIKDIKIIEKQINPFINQLATPAHEQATETIKNKLVFAMKIQQEQALRAQSLIAEKKIKETMVKSSSKCNTF